MNALTATSPIDGRYQNKTAALGDFFSEYALIKYRILVEVEYFKALVNAGIHQLADFNVADFPKLDQMVQQFTPEQAQIVKNTEKVTNHDVKAVEYYIKDFFKAQGWDKFSEFVHFGLTSQDINNTAFPMMIRDAMHKVYLPVLQEVYVKLQELSQNWASIPMLARTHGQPASPTTVGKELAVFIERLHGQIGVVCRIPNSGKFGGATGNMNAHYIAFPDKDWHGFAANFMDKHLGLVRQYPTTQIEHYDTLAARLDAMRRVNVILIDLARDIWTYISQDYFKQKINENEVGSSAMPHKVNPIDFENAEGNLGIANALLDHLANKLPISRLQRDLTDSTVLRNIGVPFAHGLIAFKSLLKGLNKLELNAAAIEADLELNWSVIAEAIQTILRREQVDGAYEKLKEFSRKNAKLGKAEFETFIQSLDVSEALKAEMLAVTPFNYVGK
ncbi:MAG: adenylosuccinate lyase [Saprospiraceae bacterium]|nr:adenylosuccinate lyase [Saprospiraceae bacterium]